MYVYTHEAMFLGLASGVTLYFLGEMTLAEAASRGLDSAGVSKDTTHMSIIDKDGNVFATGPGGVFVFAADGTHLGTLDTDEPTANCAWGDDDTVLYIATNDKLSRIKTTTKGK